MKKIVSMLLVLVMVLCFAACEATDTDAPEVTEAPASDVMTHDEYIAAAIDAEVSVETYVQATQSWWEDAITVYAQSKDGAYFIYKLACAEEDAAKLVSGTKIKVTGHKTAWSGEVEIVDATFEIIEGDTYIAEAADLTDLLGKDEMIDHQNELAAFKGLTFKELSYENGEPGADNDVYVTFTKDGVDYNFCVESYLTNPDSDVYKTVGTLNAGDVVDVEGFVYWYEGMNPHITSIALAE